MLLAKRSSIDTTASEPPQSGRLAPWTTLCDCMATYLITPNRASSEVLGSESVVPLL